MNLCICRSQSNPLLYISTLLDTVILMLTSFVLLIASALSAWYFYASGTSGIKVQEVDDDTILIKETEVKLAEAERDDWATLVYLMGSLLSTTIYILCVWFAVTSMMVMMMKTPS